MLFCSGLPAPAAIRLPSGPSWQSSKPVVSSSGSSSVTAATNCKSMLWRTGTAASEQRCYWQHGETEGGKFAFYKLLAALARWEEGLVPSVLVLPPLLDASVGAQRLCPPMLGGHMEGLRHPSMAWPSGAFPFGRVDHLFVPRWPEEDLPLSGAQVVLIPPSNS